MKIKLLDKYDILYFVIVFLGVFIYRAQTTTDLNYLFWLEITVIATLSMIIVKVPDFIKGKIKKSNQVLRNL